MTLSEGTNSVSATPVVEVSGLGKRYRNDWAVRNESFTVSRGEVFGIIGPNGAGKTTTLKILAGLLSPTAGIAKIGGVPVSDPSAKARIGYLPEESALYEDMTPVSYLRFFADLYEVPRALAEERIESLLSRLQLEVRNEKRIGDLSKGMRRKIAIARSLVHDPELLIFDEPASGLDPVVSATVLGLVQQVRAEGKTVLLSAHNLYHVERACDRVLILRKGEVLAQGSMREIRAAVGGTEFVVTLSVQVDGAKPGDHGFESTVTDLAHVKALEAAAVAAGGRLIEVKSKDLSLEEIFLRKAAR